MFSISKLLTLIHIFGIYTADAGSKWAGVIQYQNDSAPFNFVEATLVVPTFSIPAGNTEPVVGCAIWIGLDDATPHNEGDIWQAGILFAMSENGTYLINTAFWEWYPEDSHFIDDFNYAPGDSIYMNLTTISDGLYAFGNLVNLQSGQIFQFERAALENQSSKGATAEFIIESSYMALPDFGTVFFHNAQACRTDGTCVQAGGEGMEIAEINVGSGSTVNAVWDGEIELTFVRL